MFLHKRFFQLAVLPWLLLALGICSSSHAQAPALTTALEQRVQQANLGDTIGLSVVSLADGSVVYDRASDVPLNPASNMKVLTAAAALLELGPDYSFRTALYGRQEGDAIVGGLYLRGFGDPLLSQGDLMTFAAELSQRGIRQVDDLVVDNTFFDEDALPPAFEQQPEEAAAFRAAIGAVSVNRNAFELRVLPGDQVDSPARVRLDAPDYFEVDNQMVTVDRGRMKVIAIQGPSATDGDKMDLKLRGAIPRGITGASFKRRVESPAQFAGHMMLDALRAVDIKVPRRVRVGRTSPSAALLVDHYSPQLSRVLFELGKLSDNFVAEMVVRVMGAEHSTPGSTAIGAARVTAQLERLGVDVAGLKIINGSGLFDGNAVAPRHITQLLLQMPRQVHVYPEFLVQFAVAGRDGTLARRMEALPAGVVVRAKTGTLNQVIALSGYVLGAEGEGYAFSFLANGVAGKHGAARSMMDDLVTILARSIAKQ